MEAAHVTWADISFEADKIHVQGDPFYDTKNGEARPVPMLPENQLGAFQNKVQAQVVAGNPALASEYMTAAARLAAVVSRE